MGHRGQGNVGNSAAGMWLWSIVRGEEMGTRQWECGYGALGGQYRGA